MSQNISHKNIHLGFYGGVGSVTGANFVLWDDQIKIMIDCGARQGSDEDEKKNYEPFAYDPSDIDVVFVTHAHSDHIGRLPKLIKDGFRGKIYSTRPTRDLTRLMLDDAVEHVARYAQEHNLPEPLYSRSDIEKTFELWKTEDYHHELHLSNDLVVTLHDAGHVLGSAMVCLDWGGNRLLLTGDLGNSPAPLLNDTEIPPELDYLLMESVYGDRNHDQREIRSEVLEQILEDTIHRGGTVMIPAFSLERTQELLFEINNLVEKEHIPHVPVLLDSPLAIRVTDIYRQSHDFFNKETRAQIDAGDDIFDFPGLRMTESIDASKSINYMTGPKIVIAGSGMSNGGRILYHEKQYLSDPANTLVFIGFQAAGTLGRIIQDGAKQVKIYGETIPVQCQIETISGYSGHKQRDDLIDFVAQNRDTLKTVWCVMGETSSSTFLAQRLQDYLGVKAVVPEEGNIISLKKKDTH
ncbi:MBL fold metallo-hydrolase [Candidatus Nomurabacteria bacterium]|nr:MBL fold metallo-hydrolase [Candidatus Nomurabacteria bacterium]